MSRCASHKSEAIAGLQFEQPLNFELSLGGAGKRNSHVNDVLPLWRLSFERGLDEHEARASQNSIDQEEILEPIRVYRRNPTPLHSNLLPAHGATAAQGKLCNVAQRLQSDKSVHQYSYGERASFYFNARSQTARFAPAGCSAVHVHEWSFV